MTERAIGLFLIVENYTSLPLPVFLLIFNSAMFALGIIR